MVHGEDLAHEGYSEKTRQRSEGLQNRPQCLNSCLFAGSTDFNNTRYGEYIGEDFATFAQKAPDEVYNFLCRASVDGYMQQARLMLFHKLVRSSEAIENYRSTLEQLAALDGSEYKF